MLFDIGLEGKREKVKDRKEGTKKSVQKERSKENRRRRQLKFQKE